SLSLTSLAAGLAVDLSLALRYIASLAGVSDSRSSRSVSVAALSPSLHYRALSQANRWNSNRFQSVPAPKRTRASTSSCLNYADSVLASKALPYGVTHASKALEPATLVPLQLLKSSGTKCIMVGDPKQLPATVLSNVASKYLYECSMFERLQRAGHPVIMLTEQRTALIIAQLIENYFAWLLKVLRLCSNIDLLLFCFLLVLTVIFSISGSSPCRQNPEMFVLLVLQGLQWGIYLATYHLYQQHN
ncbi:hypothetical protein S83_054834, partial [Arachis hypogaea]